MSAQIFYYDIGDYLSREQKLKIISDFKSMANLPFVNITPNEHGDWISKRNDKFSSWIPIEAEKKFDVNSQSFFITHAIGVATNRDAWVYNFSRDELSKNMNRMIDFYNEQREIYQKRIENSTEKLAVEDIVSNDDKKISWTRGIRRMVERNAEIKFSDNVTIIGMYRPFSKQLFYSANDVIEMIGINKKLFPTPKHKNLVICIKGIGDKDFSCLISNCIPDLQVVFNGQCFPLYWYEEIKPDQCSLFDSADGTKYIKHEAISDFILDRARTKYGNKVSKEDIFYYVYGILHSKSYRETFSADLKKMLPRLPLVSDYQKFWDFVNAGRKLADLHLNYENIAPCSDVVVTGDDKNDFAVTQMKFVKKGEKHTIIYNDKITLSNIPQKAYDYVVNGKSAIEWIMERYAITTDKKSGIVNNPNDWAKEHNKPRYILDLLLSVINVSVQSVDIVNALPEVDWDKE